MQAWRRCVRPRHCPECREKVNARGSCRDCHHQRRRPRVVSASALFSALISASPCAFRALAARAATLSRRVNAGSLLTEASWFDRGSRVRRGRRGRADELECTWLACLHLIIVLVRVGAALFVGRLGEFGPRGFVAFALLSRDLGTARPRQVGAFLSRRICHLLVSSVVRRAMQRRLCLRAGWRYRGERAGERI